MNNRRRRSRPFFAVGTRLIGQSSRYEKTRRDKRKADRKCEIAAMRMNVGHDPLSACLRYIVRYIDLDLSSLALCTPLEREFSIRTKPGNMIDSLFTIRRTSFFLGGDRGSEIGEKTPRGSHFPNLDASEARACSGWHRLLPLHHPLTGSWSAFSEGNRFYSNANRAVRGALPEAER
jgi:hypothetical protein